MGCLLQFRREDLPVYLAGAAAVLPVISIAAFEIVLGIAIGAMIVLRVKPRWTPLWMSLVLFCAWTLIAWFASGDLTGGIPQIKKFYVYTLLVVVVSVIRTSVQVRWIALGWAASATASSAWGIYQFAEKYQDALDADKDFYRAYVADRITGFTGHWMMFSGQMMMALMIIGALVFFCRDRRWISWLIAASAIIIVAFAAAETRSMWAGAIGGGIYLLWYWRRWMILAIPVLAAALVLANPFGIGERAVSLIHPHGDLDSNMHRSVTRRIGWEMIKAHPLLGVGPEQVAKEYKKYIPADIPRPLPSGYYGHLHNIYIQFAAERGIPAALAILWLLIRAFYDFLRALRGLPDDAPQLWILHGAVAATIAVVIGSFFEYNLGTSVSLAMFLAILGCGYAAVYEVTDARVARSSPS